MRILEPDIGFKRLVRSLGRLAFVQDKVPDFDVSSMNLDVLKVLQNAHIEESYAPELKPAFSMFPCVYRGQTYLGRKRCQSLCVSKQFKRIRQSR